MPPSQDPSIPTPIVMMIVLMKDPVQTAFDAAHKSRTFYLCEESHDIGKPLGQTAHDAGQHHDHQDVHRVRFEKMCIGEVTEEDMMHKLLECEKHGHEKDSRGVFFFGKGNGSLPWSDNEEWEFGDSGSGGSEGMRRPGWSEDRRR